MITTILVDPHPCWGDGKRIFLVPSPFSFSSEPRHCSHLSLEDGQVWSPLPSSSVSRKRREVLHLYPRQRERRRIPPVSVPIPNKRTERGISIERMEGDPHCRPNRRHEGRFVVSLLFPFLLHMDRDERIPVGPRSRLRLHSYRKREEEGLQRFSPSRRER